MTDSRIAVPAPDLPISVYEVELEFTEAILGTVPKSEDVYRDYILTKAPPEAEEDELETLDADNAKAQTGFHMLTLPNGQTVPAVYDYMVKGFFKEACGALRRVKGSKSSRIRAYKKVINLLLKVEPRLIPFQLPEGQTIGFLSRPVRASTPQGERVALLKSETLPPGTRLKFRVQLLDPDLYPAFVEWLGYGQNLGLGQWRGGGWGTFRSWVTPVLEASA